MLNVAIALVCSRPLLAISVERSRLSWQQLVPRSRNERSRAVIVDVRRRRSVRRPASSRRTPACPRARVSGVPTNERGVGCASIGALDRGIALPFLRRRRQLDRGPAAGCANACRPDDARNRASSSVSAANDVDAEHHVRPLRAARTARSGRDRSRSPPSAAPARSARRTQTAARAPRRPARRTVLDPRIQIGTSQPGAGHGAHWLAGLRLGEERHHLQHVRGNSSGLLLQRAPQRPRRRRIGARARGRDRDRCGPGYSDSSVPNCSAIT